MTALARVAATLAATAALAAVLLGEARAATQETEAPSARSGVRSVGAALKGLVHMVAADPEIEAIDSDIQDWDIASADRIASDRLRRTPSDAAALLAGARVAFYESDYERALSLAKRAAGPAPAGAPAGLSGEPDSAAPADAETALQSGAADLAAWIEARKPTWSSFVEHRTDNFVLRTTEKDAILVPDALATLEAASTALGEDLGWCPDRPVVVEIYPTRRSFIDASTLTQEEVETSGTVAICHFNRLMVLSPGVLDDGYEWLDTLCHEYTHYVVYHVAGSGVPVWLHEGIAKSLETRWRGPRPAEMDPRLASVLREGLDRGKWVTFAQMSPSMAKLPSASLVTLAFAQVTAGTRMLMDEAGSAEPVRRLLAAIKDRGGDVDEALQAATGDTLESFEARVRDAAATMPLKRIPGATFLDEDGSQALGPRFRADDRAGGKAPESPDETPEGDAKALRDHAARDFTLLGDRLQGRGFFDAALVEYDKALSRLQQSEPMVVNRAARVMIHQGRLEDARRTLTESLTWFPSLATTLDNLAEVELRLGRAPGADAAAAHAHDEAALDLARRSEQVNPFNPDTHVRLEAACKRLGLRAEAERSRERLDLLRGR